MKELEKEEGVSRGTVRTRIEQAEQAMRDEFVRRGVTERPSCLADPTDMLFPRPPLEPDDAWEATRVRRRRRATPKKKL